MQRKRMKVTELKRLYAERWHYPPALKKRPIKYAACGEKPNYDLNDPPEYTACWKSPLQSQPEIQFGPCWEYPPERYKRRPPPPPCRGATLPVELLVPTFKHCSSLYTKYDFRLEQCVHEQILVVEQLFDELDRALNEAKAFQIEKAEQMRYQAMRYRLLIGGACCTKIYPEYLSSLAEQRALCEFQKAFNDINRSNCDLGDAVMAVNDALPELYQRIDRLDHTQQSPFLLGDGYDAPSLSTVMQMIEDLYRYFFGVARKFKCWAQLIDPTQEFSIEDYLALLQDKSDFESFLQAGTEKCTCKRCDKKNPFKPYLPCWCQMRDFCEDRVKPKPPYECDMKYLINVDFNDSEAGKLSKMSVQEAETEKGTEPSDVQLVKSEDGQMD